MPKHDRTLKQIGDPCPDCRRKHKFGRLAPVAMKEPMLFGGAPEQRVDHLVCTRCRGKHRAKSRGLELRHLREGVLPNFKNSRRKPRQCPSCAGELARGDNGSLSSKRPRPPCVAYLYCPTCNRILWVIKPLTPKQLDIHRHAETRRFLKMHLAVENRSKPPAEKTDIGAFLMGFDAIGRILENAPPKP
jgi:hypothetical protein